MQRGKCINTQDAVLPIKVKGMAREEGLNPVGSLAAPEPGERGWAGESHPARLPPSLPSPQPPVNKTLLFIWRIIIFLDQRLVGQPEEVLCARRANGATLLQRRPRGPGKIPPSS